MLRSVFWDLAHLVHVTASKGKQCDLTGLLYCASNHALMFGAGARLAARADVTFISDIFSEKVSLFIVDGQGLICTELAELGLGKEAAFATLARLLPFV